MSRRFLRQLELYGGWSVVARPLVVPLAVTRGPSAGCLLGQQPVRLQVQRWHQLLAARRLLG